MKYYTCANTSSGFVDLTTENVFDVYNQIKLVCQNSYVKSYVLGFLKGNSEKIISAGSKNFLDGLVFRGKNMAVVSRCDNPCRTFDLDRYFEIDTNNDNEFLYNMFECYAQAKEIHDEWETIYIKNMDFARLDKFCSSIIDKLADFSSTFGEGKTYKRFFGTVTPLENVNFISDLTENIQKRYFIKGRPGTGKSTFLKKLSATLKEKNFDVEEYYCSFDSNSLDMVICRELSLCVFDSTPPHEKFPQRETDEILDFYVESGLSGIDEKYEKELFFIKSAYDFKIKEGKDFFKKAYNLKVEKDKEALAKIKESELRQIARNIEG